MTDFPWHRWVIAAGLLAITVLILWSALVQPSWVDTLSVLIMAAVCVVAVRFALRWCVGLVRTAIVDPVQWLFASATMTAHGSARFAGGHAIARGPLCRDGQVFLGSFINFLGQVWPLASTGNENVLVTGSSRSGKGVSNVVPSLLGWQGSAIVHDRKAELYSLTAGYRGTLGRVVKFAPGEPGSARFNFLSEIRTGTEHEIADAQNVSTSLIEDVEHGEAQHWIDTARELVAAVIVFCLHHDAAASLADVARTLSDPVRPIAELYRDMRSDPSPLVSGIGRAMADRAEREASSIVSTVLRALVAVRDPLVARNIGASDFQLDDIADGDAPCSVYVTTKAVDAPRLRPLVRLFFELAMAKMISAELRFENGVALPAHRHRVLLVIDELPSLGKLPVVEDSMAQCLGYGVAVLAAIQSTTQLRKHFGLYEMISANCGVHVHYPPAAGGEDAERISRALGTTTAVIELQSSTGGTSRSSSPGGQGSSSSGRSSSSTTSLQFSGRPLLFPDEVARLIKPERDAKGLISKPGAVLIFQTGRRPVLGTQLLWWHDPEMRRRAALPPGACCLGGAPAPTSNVIPFPQPRRIIAEGVRAAAIALAIIVSTAAFVPLWRTAEPAASQSLANARTLIRLPWSAPSDTTWEERYHRSLSATCQPFVAEAKATGAPVLPICAPFMDPPAPTEAERAQRGAAKEIFHTQQLAAPPTLLLPSGGKP